MQKVKKDEGTKPAQNPDKKVIEVEVPAKELVRYKFLDERTVTIDFNGIRVPGRLLNGHPNPTKGSKPTYANPYLLQAEVDKYFESLYGYVRTKNGNLLKNPDGTYVRELQQPPTVSGLALYLGMSTDTLKRWSKGRIDKINSEYDLTCADVIKVARQRIEAYAESRSYDAQGQRGAEFILRSAFGWRTPKEQAEIEKIQVDNEIKRKMFELKKALVDSGLSDDDITINIVRKEE